MQSGLTEPGRLDAMRRREYFRADTRMELKPGPIDAVLIGSMQAWRATRSIFMPLAVMSAASGSKKSSIWDAPLTSFQEKHKAQCASFTKHFLSRHVRAYR